MALRFIFILPYIFKPFLNLNLLYNLQYFKLNLLSLHLHIIKYESQVMFLFYFFILLINLYCIYDLLSSNDVYSVMIVY